MRLQQEGWSIEAGIRKGRELPDWYLNRPEVPAAAEWYLEAFWDLSTGRPVTDYGVHPIAWRDIVTYAEVNGLDPDNYQTLRQVIREMDATWRKWQVAERERKSKNSPKPES